MRRDSSGENHDRGRRVDGRSATTARLVLEDVCPAIAPTSPAARPTEDLKMYPRASSRRRAPSRRRDVRDDSSSRRLRVNAPSAHSRRKDRRRNASCSSSRLSRRSQSRRRRAFRRRLRPHTHQVFATKFCNADELNRVNALVHVATSMLARRSNASSTFYEGRCGISSRPRAARVLIADVLSLLARALGPASEEFIFRAKIALLPPCFDHLDDCTVARTPTRGRANGAWFLASRDEDEHGVTTRPRCLRCSRTRRTSRRPRRARRRLVSWRAQSRRATIRNRSRASTNVSS